MDADDSAGATEELNDASNLLVQAIDRLTDDELRADSLLPGWSRAHVVAHLALNAEGLADVLDGASHERPVPMYASDESRDADIEELAAGPTSELRDRTLSAVRRFREELDELPETVPSASFERTPGGSVVPIAQVPLMRRREVEIHHADLDVGYTSADWPASFCVELLDAVVRDHAASADSPDFSVHADDLGRDWVGGAREPVVSGPAHVLGWWLTGRGDGSGLTCDGVAVPALGAWRRADPH